MTSPGASYRVWSASAVPWNSSPGLAPLQPSFATFVDGGSSTQKGWVVQAFARAVYQSPSLLGLPPQSPIHPDTPQQWNEIFGMMQNLFSKDKLFDNISWILDSGASRHMTGHIKCLFNIVSISPCYIGILNGAQTVATSEICVFLG